jgi:hypothetical protein
MLRDDAIRLEYLMLPELDNFLTLFKVILISNKYIMYFPLTKQYFGLLLLSY